MTMAAKTSPMNRNRRQWIDRQWQQWRIRHCRHWWSILSQLVIAIVAIGDCYCRRWLSLLSLLVIAIVAIGVSHLRSPWWRLLLSPFAIDSGCHCRHFNVDMFLKTAIQTLWRHFHLSRLCIEITVATGVNVAISVKVAIVAIFYIIDIVATVMSDVI